MRHFLALTLLASLSCCGGAPPAMISHESALSRYRVELFAENNTLAVRVQQPGGANMVVYDPTLESGAVAITAGLWSGGSAMTRVYCFDLSSLAPPGNWADHLVWREPGEGVAEAVAVQGREAHDAISSCRSPR